MRFPAPNEVVLCVSLVLIAATIVPAAPPACTPDAGDCCVENPSPGCNHAPCCARVCACDPDCCDVVWDEACATFGHSGNDCGAAILCDICMDFDADRIPDDIDACCDTPAGVSVDERGRPLGDLDWDCDVDLLDFGIFQQNARGPADAVGACCDIHPSQCDDLDPCTVDSCDPVTGCVHDPVICPEGEECDPATGDCVPAICKKDADCNDGLFCTGAGMCDPHDPNADANGCTWTGNPCGGETPICDESTDTCEACAADADCDDGVLCTDDNCLGTGACDNDPIGARCDNAVFCDGVEACDPAHADADEFGCVSSGNPCSGDTPVCDEGTETCNACTANADCDDGVPCTDDICNGVTGACTNTPNHGNCPDPDFCDGVDFCDPGDTGADGDGCVAPGNPCGGAAPICDEAADDCFPCESNAECDDAVACTVDTCDGLTGECTNTPDDGLCPGPGDPANAVFCDPVLGCVECIFDGDCFDGFSCTADACRTSTGDCLYTPIDARCEDGLFCTGEGDACNPDAQNAEAHTGCVRPGNPCGGDTPFCNEAADTCDECETNADCDDDVPCTHDVCNGSTGECTNTPNDANCPDPEFCDGVDVCDPGHPDADSDGCLGPGNPCRGDVPVCNESTNACEACATDDDCNDGVPCTDDGCQPSGACDNLPNNAFCDNAVFCDGVETCDPADEDADALGCVSPGNPCGGGAPICDEAFDLCRPCEANAECDDGVACTVDLCNGVTGECFNTPDDGLCPGPGDPVNAYFCDPDLGCVECISNSDCFDGVFCNGSETCAGGQCRPGTYPCDPASTTPICDEARDGCRACNSSAECQSIGLTACNGLTGECF